MDRSSRSVPESWEVFLRIVDEGVAVAGAEGVDLEDARARHGNFAAGLEPATYSSLYDDMINGRPMELEALHGALVRLGEPHGLEVPLTKTVSAVLKPWSLRNRRDTG
jgi:2-dehydropantoate 2-reductase